MNMPGFAFVLSGSQFLPRLVEYEQDFLSMGELRSHGGDLWSVCLYARGISQATQSTTVQVHFSLLAAYSGLMNRFTGTRSGSFDTSIPS